MDILKRLKAFTQQNNAHLNCIACAENDFSTQSCQQLLDMITQSTDKDLRIALKKILISRGYTRQEILLALQQTPPILS